MLSMEKDFVKKIAKRERPCSRGLAPDRETSQPKRQRRSSEGVPFDHGTSDEAPRHASDGHCMKSAIERWISEQHRKEDPRDRR